MLPTNIYLNNLKSCWTLVDMNFIYQLYLFCSVFPYGSKYRVPGWIWFSPLFLSSIWLMMVPFKENYGIKRIPFSASSKNHSKNLSAIFHRFLLNINSESKETLITLLPTWFCLLFLSHNYFCSWVTVLSDWLHWQSNDTVASRQPQTLHWPFSYCCQLTNMQRP